MRKENTDWRKLPRKSPDAKLGKSISFRVSETAYERICRNAEEEGQGRAEYVRRIVMKSMEDNRNGV